MHRIHRLSALLLIAVLIAGCSGSSDLPFQATTVQDISGAELEALMDGPGDVVVLDVRTAAEYQTAHIPGSVNIPLDELPQRLGELNSDIPTVCVCASGVRSEQAAQLLVTAGFDTVYNLAGGVGSSVGLVGTGV